MGTVTVLWLLCAALAMALAGTCGTVWLVERRNRASLMLCILGLAAAVSACIELGMMQSAGGGEYGTWLRWYHVPVFLTLVGQLLFVHYYLGTGRLWLLRTVIFLRSVVLAVNFILFPNFNFAQIVSLRHVSFLGSQISVLGDVIPRDGWQLFATASLILWLAYLIDAAARLWMSGEPESRRKASAVILSIAAPLFATVVYTQSLAYGFVRGPISNLVWFLGALTTMAYETGRDVLLRRAAQQELSDLRRQLTLMERLNVAGHLSAALAHDLAQPLTAATANTEAALLLMNRGKTDIKELQSILSDVHGAHSRAAGIIAQMRQLFRQPNIAILPLELAPLLQDGVELVRPEAESNHISIPVLIQPGLPDIRGDRVHLLQVLLNLLMNSVEAMQSQPADARRIVIEARSRDADGGVEVAVKDSGPGIPASIADKIFQPFFTTKPEAIGMGLSLSRAIIEAHGGRLWADRTPPREGATFRFILQPA